MDESTIEPAIVKKDEDAEVVFVKALNGLDPKVKGLIGSYDAGLSALEQLQNSANKRPHAKGLEAQLNEADEAVKTAKTALVSSMRDLNKAAETFLHGVYILASRRQNPAIFYGKSSNSLASPRDLGNSYTPEEGKARRDEEQQALDGIDGVAISSGDTVKEINRLLDLTSTKRMAEEMDIVTYQSNAKRLFDRVQDEFNQALALFTADQVRVRKMLAAIDDFTSKSNNWITDPQLAADAPLPLETGAPVSANPIPTAGARSILAADPEFIAAATAMVTAHRFLVRYNNFLDYAKGYAGNIGREFYTEASVDAFKDATREHAQRIEKRGLFSSYLTLSMGALSALIVAIILVFLDNNLAFKNWIIPLTGAAAAIGYFVSVVFGRVARDGIMGDLRGALFESVSRTSYGPQAGTTTQDAGREAYNYFKFPTLGWASFDSADTSKTSAAAAKDSPVSLAKTLTDIGKTKWPVRVSAMRWGNGALLAAVVFVTASISCLSGNPGWRRSFAFISRTNELGSCVLERGRVLLASGDSYFVETRDGKPVTEVAKSLVLRIAPIPMPEETTRTKEGYVRIGGDDPQAKPAAADTTPTTSELPDCDDPRPEPKAPDLLAAGADIKQGLETVAGKIGTSTTQFDPKSLANLMEAARLLANSLKEWLDAVTKHIPESSGCPCTTSASAAPIMPVIISMPPAATPDLQSGPTVLTMIYTSDGKGHEIGDGGMLLPVFLDPVTGTYDPAFWGKKGIDTQEKAFYFGAHSLTDLKLPGAEIRRKILKEYAASYTSCMKRAMAAGAGKLKLIVEGYASEDWQAEKTGEERQNLNLFLAEGRRIAVINALEADPSLIEIENWQQSPAFSHWSQVKADEVHGNFLFKTYGAMSDSVMKTLPQLRMPAGFLAHTALVRIDGEPPEQCRHPG